MAYFRCKPKSSVVIQTDFAPCYTTSKSNYSSTTDYQFYAKYSYSTTANRQFSRPYCSVTGCRYAVLNDSGTYKRIVFLSAKSLMSATIGVNVGKSNSSTATYSYTVTPVYDSATNTYYALGQATLNQGFYAWHGSNNYDCEYNSLSEALNAYKNSDQRN